MERSKRRKKDEKFGVLFHIRIIFAVICFTFWCLIQTGVMWVVKKFRRLGHKDTTGN